MILSYSYVSEFQKIVATSNLTMKTIKDEVQALKEEVESLKGKIRRFAEYCLFHYSCKTEAIPLEKVFFTYVMNS